MKLMEFFATPDGKKNDPLMTIVRDLNNEKARLVELRRQAQGFLIPISTKGGKVEARIDPELMLDATAAAKEIDSCKGKIAELEDKITIVDEIIVGHGIERPLLRELVKERGSIVNGLARKKAQVASTLGHVLMFRCSDEDAARRHPEFLKAAAIYERAKANGEPRIAKLEAVIEELRAVI